jgi:hypothetical protein
MNEPTTDAGKRLLERPWNQGFDLRADVVAIEAEAREQAEMILTLIAANKYAAAVLRELRDEVSGMPGASPAGVCIFRSVVLEAIDRRLP